MRAYVEGGGRFILEPALDASPPSAATPPTAPSCAATTFRATTGCARSSMPSGSPTTATSRSPAGRSRGCGSPTSTACSRSPCPRSTRAGGSPIPGLGGRIELQANSLAIVRTEGQDSQRAFASARWDRRMITPLGQELVLTAYARGDLYHASDTLLTQTVSYRGEEGWSGRFIGAVAADMRWPFVGEFLGGTQRFTPARPVRRLAADREYGHSQRGRALGRPRGFEPVRAEPLPRLRPLGGRRARHLRRSTGRSICRASRSAPRSARATGSTSRADDPAAGHRPFRAASPTSSAAPTSASAASSASPTASASTRTASRSAATRSTRWSAAGAPMRRSAICGSTATSIRRSRICATARRSGSAAGSASPATGRSSARR